MTKILAFTPYAAWRMHANYETTITQSCRLRGAEVKHILCDGVFSECNMYNAAISATGRPFNLCENCQAGAKAVFEETGLPYEWLSSYIEPDERREAFTWAQNLQPEEFSTANYRQYPVGQWVATSVISYFREPFIPLDDWHKINVYRGFLHGVAIACIGLERVLNDWAPDAMIVFNGRLSVTRVALELAKQKGIRVLVHESPRSPGTLYVVENNTCVSPVPFQQFWQQWADVPLTWEQLETVSRWIQERRYARNKADFQFASPPGDADKIREELGLVWGRKLIALFTSSTDEFSGDPDIQSPFPSQEVWIEKVVEWLSQHPDCDLVIRAHPCLSGKAGIGYARSQVEWFQQLKERLPTNARLILPNESLSSYDLMDIADLGLAYGSTAGVEMFALGKPVAVVPSFSIYEDVPGIVQMKDPNDLFSTLDRALKLQPSRDFRCYAFRCIYRCYFHMQVPFPLVSKVAPFESKINYETPEALMLGADPGLDRICAFLLENQPIFSGPNPKSTWPSQAEEDAFFEKLENSIWPKFEVSKEERLLHIWKIAYHSVRSSLRQSIRCVGRPIVNFIRQAILT